MDSATFSPPLRRPPTPARPARPLAQDCIGLCGGYFALALLSLLFAPTPGATAPLWYASALAMLVLRSRAPRHWPALLAALAAGAFGAQLLSDMELVAAARLLPAHLAEGALGGWLLSRLDKANRAYKRPDVLIEALLHGCVLPGVVAAAIGAAVLAATGPQPWGTAFFAWLGAALLGSATALPLGLAYLGLGLEGLTQRLRSREGLLLLALSLSVALAAPLSSLPNACIFVALPLACCALRLDFGATAVVAGFTSVCVSALLALGVLDAGNASGGGAVLATYVPLLLTLVPPLLLAASLEQARRERTRLAQSEARYRQLYRKTPALLQSVDAEGRLLSVSDLWLSRMGYERDEVLGRPATDFLEPASRARAARLRSRLTREGSAHNIGYRARTKSGELLDIRVSAVLDHDARGEPSKTLAAIADVTEEKKLGAALAMEHELLRVTLRSIGEAVLTTDCDGRITDMNPVAEAVLGRGREQLRGRPFAEAVKLFDAVTREPLADPVGKCLATGLKVVSAPNAVLVDPTGAVRALQHTVAPIRAADGAVHGSVMVFQDVSEDRARSLRLAHQAQHDPLTGLPNRVLFEDRLQQACHAAQRQQTQFAVCYLDLDHFKQVNDTLGHAAGDALLRTVAKRLTGSLRTADTVCRQGGDEFLVLLNELDSHSDVRAIAAKLVERIAAPYTLDGRELHVSLSLGAAVFPRDGTDPGTLTAHADAAMYRAKQGGRNGYRLFSG